MASNNRQQAQHERKQDRTHISEGQRRASQAAEQRRRQAQAERDRVERANEEMRAKRRDRPDILDTTTGIEAEGAVGVGPDGIGGYFIPFSVTERDDRQMPDHVNAAAAVYRPHEGTQRVANASPLLRDNAGYPKMRANFMERIDPDSREQDLQEQRRVREAEQYALTRLAQEARDEKRSGHKTQKQRRFIAWQLHMKGVPRQVIGQQLGVSKSLAYTYVSDAKERMREWAEAWLAGKKAG